ncbi:MAG: alpha/beta hydrolase [Acetobacteraceae bacterium]
MPIGPTARALAGAALLAWAPCAMAQTAAPPARDVPARSLPVPGDVSPEIQSFIAQPLRQNWDHPPTTPEAWQALVSTGAAALAQNVPGMRERLHVSVQPTTMDGVKVFVVTPDVVAPENQNRVLIHVHGGCYVLNPGEAALPEAIFMAGFGHFKVISVDYRMPPAAYYPAALDDAMTVYKAVIKATDPKNVAIFGSSAGGALTLEMVLRAKQDGLPLPGAIAPGTPMSDVTKVGDSFQTNKLVDNVLVSPDGFCDAATVFYAHGHDLHDPMLSPVYGDMSGFPPTILTTGTRDLLLSNTVRVHRKLREAGVEASLQVYEAQSHAYFIRDDRTPETKEAFGEIAGSSISIWGGRRDDQARPGLCPGPAKGRGPLETMIFVAASAAIHCFPILCGDKQPDFKGFAFDGIEGRSCQRFRLAGSGQLEWQRRESPRLPYPSANGAAPPPPHAPGLAAGPASTPAARSAVRPS